MIAPLLVAYATKYGSTREVAETIAAALCEQGIDAEASSVTDVRMLDGYRAVVLGAPLYIGRWPSEAQQFLTRYREELAELPVAVFALGPLTAEADEVRGAREQLDQELARYPWLTPVSIAMFGGRYDPSHLSFAHKLMAKMPATPLHGRPASDARDWSAIRAWARETAQRLQPAPGSILTVEPEPRVAAATPGERAAQSLTARRFG